MPTLTLSARPPFSFYHTVRSHGWYQLAPFEWDEDARMLTCVLRLISGKVIALHLDEAPGGVRAAVKGRLTKRERAELIEAVTWMLSLDQDFSDFYAAARGEPKLAQAEKIGRGRVLRSPTFFEDVLKTILTTNTLWVATKRMNNALIEAFGQPLNGDSSRRAFPTPEVLAAATPEMLRSEIRLGYRAPYVHELAERVASGQLDLEAYKTCELPTLELRKELLQIKGVGPYAAANLLMLLGRPDFIPVDSWAMKMVSLEWHDGGSVGPAEVEAAFERWGQWKGMAYWFWQWDHDE
jgi:3-methyladenine DNA glycosylase/8-oxoguanine DNA glycosylase